MVGADRWTLVGLAVVAAAHIGLFLYRLVGKGWFQEDIFPFLFTLALLAGLVAGLRAPGVTWAWVRLVLYLLLAVGVFVAYASTTDGIQLWANMYYLAFAWLVALANEALAGLVRWFR